MTQPAFHRFDHKGKHFALYFDYDYTPRGAYALATDEETQAAEDEEIAKLGSGEWVVVYCEVIEDCPSEHHCACCGGQHITDSLCGIVIENDITVMEKTIPELMGL